MFAGEFARKQPAGERAPDQQSHLLVEQHRPQFPFQLATRQRVVRLQGDELFEVVEGRDSERLHDLPCREIGAADVADLPLPDQIGKGAERLFKRREAVEAVDLIEVDVVRVETQQTGFDSMENMKAGETYLIGARPHASEHFGRNHDVFALVAEGLAEHRLRLARGIDIRRIEEVDARVEGVIDQRINVVLGQSADHLKDAAFAAKGHGAETEAGNEDSGVAELLIFHSPML